MPSLVPGFEYDIFISYRQKDNKGDHWVTEFVTALRSELEATLKEDLSIYFDENPHDGLLETHNVDKSLEGKLKCLLFIPILSQTYCDPRSFAWKHEFCVFNKMARDDQFGRDIRLANGNVASRILPIKIHELDTSDRAVIENELSGVLRGVDFIFKSPGVNRALRPDEEDPKENLNHTTYRNQINKVANAIKEVISSVQLAAGKTPDSAIHSIQAPVVSKGSKFNVRLSKPAGILVFLLLMSVLLFYVYKNTTAAKTGRGYDYDVAVMYLENFTDNEKYGDQLASLIHINLAGDTSLRVLPRQLLFDQMKESTGLATAPDREHSSDIARRTGAKTMLTGSVHQQNDKVLVQLELVDVVSGKIVKSEKLEGPMDQIFGLADNVCKQMTNTTFRQEFNVALKTTGNYLAYQKFYSGLEDFYGFELDGAAEKFQEAIALDSTFALGYLFLALSQNIFVLINVESDLQPSLALVEQARKYSLKLSDQDRKIVEVYHRLFKGKLSEAAGITGELVKNNPDDRLSFQTFLMTSYINGNQADLKVYENYLLHHPSDGLAHNQTAYAYANFGYTPQAELHIKRYIELEPKNPNAFDSGWEISLICGKAKQAQSYLDTLKHIERIAPFRDAGHYLALDKPKELKLLYRAYKDSLPDQRSFQEMLPLSLALEGKFQAATHEFEILSLAFEKKQRWDAVLFLQLHKGIILIAGHQYHQAIEAFEKTIKLSVAKLENQYNPCLLLSHYYAGIAFVRQGNFEEAENKLRILESLIDKSLYDWRFKMFAGLLMAEIEAARGNYVSARKALVGMPSSAEWASMGYLSVSYMLDWKTSDFDQALKRILPFYKNFSRSRISQGGNPAHFTWELAFSDYTIARIYEDAGNKKDAVKYYNSFLERFKDSDPGIPEKEDAQRRLKALVPDGR